MYNINKVDRIEIINHTSRVFHQHDWKDTMMRLYEAFPKNFSDTIELGRNVILSPGDRLDSCHQCTEMWAKQFTFKVLTTLSWFSSGEGKNNMYIVEFDFQDNAKTLKIFISNNKNFIRKEREKKEEVNE